MDEFQQSADRVDRTGDSLKSRFLQNTEEKTTPPIQTERIVSSEYFSKKCKDQTADESLDDFRTPKLIKKPARTLNAKATRGKSKTQTARRSSAKDAAQPDIRKALTRKQLRTIRDEISSVCLENSSDVDPEHMQLAIALSESMKRVENPVASASSSGSLPSKSKYFTLDQFGFRPRACVVRKTERNPLVKVRTRKKRLKPHDLVLKSASEKRQLVADRYSNVLFSIIAPVHGKNESFIFKLTQFLEVHLCVNNRLFYKSSMTYFEMEQVGAFYVKGLVEKSAVPPGYFLKDWSKIPGRDASPPRLPTTDTINLTFNDQSDLDLLLSGTRELCTTKLKHKKIEESIRDNQDIESGKKSPESDDKLQSESKHYRRYSTSPDLFADETFLENSFIMETDDVIRVSTVNSPAKKKLNSIIISQSDEEDNLPKVVLTQVNVTKNCNSAESKCCSQKSCVMELTECVGAAIQSSGTIIEGSQEMFLNNLIDLTQTDVCNIDDSHGSSDDCAVTQVFETDNGICHFEAFRKSKECNNSIGGDSPVSRNTSTTSQESVSCIPSSKKDLKRSTDKEIFCHDVSSTTPKQNLANETLEVVSIDIMGKFDDTVNPETVNLELNTQPLNYSILNTQYAEHYEKPNETSSEYSFNLNDSMDRVKLLANKSSSSGMTVSSGCDAMKQTDGNSASLKSLVSNDSMTCKSAATSGLSVSQSSLDEIVNISDEELNYSIDKAKTLNSSANAINNLAVSHRYSFSEVQTSSHCEERTANFELGGSSIFNQVPSFSMRMSEIPENEPNGLKTRNKTLERLKIFGSVSRVDRDSSDDTLPVVNVASKVQKCSGVVDSTIYVTPMNKNYIVKTDNVTPLPDYNAMDSPNINVYLDNYGIRKLKRKRAVQLLQHIYYETHPIVDCKDTISSDESTNRRKRKKLFHENAHTMVPLNNETAPKEDPVLLVPNCNTPENEDLDDRDLYLSIATSGVAMTEIRCDVGDWVFQKRERAKIHGCRVPLHLAFHNYITARPKVHEMILRYEPVNIDLIHKGLAMEGHKYDPKDLFKFLDKKCITIKTEDKSGANRHVAKRKTTGRPKKSKSNEK